MPFIVPSSAAIWSASGSPAPLPTYAGFVLLIYATRHFASRPSASSVVCSPSTVGVMDSTTTARATIQDVVRWAVMQRKAGTPCMGRDAKFGNLKDIVPAYALLWHFSDCSGKS